MYETRGLWDRPNGCSWSVARLTFFHYHLAPALVTRARLRRVSKARGRCFFSCWSGQCKRHSQCPFSPVRCRQTAAGRHQNGDGTVRNNWTLWLLPATSPTVPATSVEVERAFSAAGIFALSYARRWEITPWTPSASSDRTTVTVASLSHG